jgi:hypothetical protein
VVTGILGKENCKWIELAKQTRAASCSVLAVPTVPLHTAPFTPTVSHPLASTDAILHYICLLCKGEKNTELKFDFKSSAFTSFIAFSLRSRKA